MQTEHLGHGRQRTVGRMSVMSSSELQVLPQEKFFRTSSFEYRLLEKFILCAYHSLSPLHTSSKHQQKPQLAMERTPTRHSSKGIASSFKAYTSTVSNKFLSRLLTSPHRIIPVNYEIDCNAIRDVQAHSGFQSFEQTDDFNAIRDVQAHSGHHPL